MELFTRKKCVHFISLFIFCGTTLVNYPLMACITCNKPVQLEIFNEDFILLLFKMALIFGLTSLFARFLYRLK